MSNKSNVTTDTKDTHGKGKKMTGKRIAALVCVILLVGLYVMTLIAAIFDKSESRSWFTICLIGTVVIPLLTWVYIWLYGLMTQKHTIASFDVRSEEEKALAEAARAAAESEKASKAE